MCSLEIEDIIAKMTKMVVLDFSARAKMRATRHYFSREKIFKIFRILKILKILVNFSSESFFFFFNLKERKTLYKESLSEEKLFFGMG